MPRKPNALEVRAMDRRGKPRPVRACRPGQALLACVPEDPSDEIVEALIRARRSAPYAPLVIQPTSDEPASILAAGAIARETGARAVWTPDKSRDDVAFELNSTGTLAEDTAVWVGIVRPDLAMHVVDRVEALVRSALNGTRVREAASELGIRKRALQKGLAKRELAIGDHWIRFARVAPGICRGCREPQAGYDVLAMEGRYSDSNSFLRAARNTTGRKLPPTNYLGWEWIAHAAGLHRRPS